MELKIFFQKAVAFIKRDLLIEFSYRFQLLLNCLSIFFLIAIFFYISQLFGKAFILYLKDYKGEYFPFVMIGIAFHGYLTMTLRSFSTNIRKEQMMGTLEAMLVTPTKLSTIIFSMSFWKFVFSSIFIFLYLLLGVYVFRLNLTGANFFSAIIILILTIILFSSMGIISVSFIMVFKRGDPITWLINLFSALFGGVYFPITLLPENLRFISYFLPITYALRALRHALLRGDTFRMLLPDITVLLFFSILLLPLSILIFKYAVRKAKIAEV